jgi:transposase
MMARRRGQPYSQDLRERVLSTVGSSALVAERFGVSISYVIKARQRRDRHGDLCAGPQRSQTPAKLAGHDEVLKARVADVPDATLAELTAWVHAELGISLSITAMWTRLRRLGLTLKKRRLLLRSEHVRTLPKHVASGTS